MTTGPGTELKKILEWFRIYEDEKCPCKSRAQQMDDKGVEWSRKHADIIVTWLEEAAKQRGIPFTRWAGKIIVKRAIANAERKAALTQKEE